MGNEGRIAEKKGLKMVRIPYWEFEDIEKIINELFGQGNHLFG